MNKDDMNPTLIGVPNYSYSADGWSATNITLERVLKMRDNLLLDILNNELIKFQFSIANLIRECAISFEGLVRLGRAIRCMSVYGRWGNTLKQFCNQIFVVRPGNPIVRLETWLGPGNFAYLGYAGISVSTFIGELLSIRSRIYPTEKYDIQTLLDYTYLDFLNIQGTMNFDLLKQACEPDPTIANARVEHKKDTESFNSWVEKVTKGCGALVSQLWDSARNKQLHFISGGFANSLQDAYGDAGDDRMMEVVRLVAFNRLYPRRVDIIPRQQITHSFAEVYQPRFYGGGVQYIYRGNDSIFDQSSKCITFRDVYLYVNDPTSQYAWLWEEVNPTTTLTGFEKGREQAEKQMQGFVENPLVPEVWVDEMAKSNPLRYGWMGWSTPLEAILYLMYTIWKKLPS